MYQEQIYLVDPASVAYAQLVGLTAVAVTALVCGSLTARFGLRAWWMILAAVVVVPVAIVVPMGGALAPINWSHVADSVAPLAVSVGLVGAALGVLIGGGVRWLFGRLRA